MRSAEEFGEVLGTLSAAGQISAGIKLALGSLADPKARAEGLIWLATSYAELNRPPLSLHYALLAKKHLGQRVPEQLEQLISLQSACAASRVASHPWADDVSTPYRLRIFDPQDSQGALTWMRQHTETATPLMGPFVFIAGADLAHAQLESTGTILPLPVSHEGSQVKF